METELAGAKVLAISRRLPEARDNQHKKFWRGMIGDLTDQCSESDENRLCLQGNAPLLVHAVLDLFFKAHDVAGVRGAGIDDRQGMLTRDTRRAQCKALGEA